MSNVKYMYVRNMEKKRDITIISDLIEKDGKFFVKCAWTFRTKKDNFVKKIGRNIAKERLNNNDPKYSVEFEVDKNNVRFFYIAAELLRKIICSDTTPKQYLKDLKEDLEYFDYYSDTSNDVIFRKQLGWEKLKEVLS